MPLATSARQDSLFIRTMPTRLLSDVCQTEILPVCRSVSARTTETGESAKKVLIQRAVHSFRALFRLVSIIRQSQSHNLCHLQK